MPAVSGLVWSTSFAWDPFDLGSVGMVGGRCDVPSCGFWEGMMSTVAGWYSDPSDASRLRWWDGAQWTEHVQAVPAPVNGRATVQTVTSSPAPRGRRRAWIVGISIAVATALVVTVGVVTVRSLNGGFEQEVALPTESEPVAGRSWNITEPLLDLSGDATITFPADYDYTAKAGGATSGNDDWAFEVFLDSALQDQAGVFVSQVESGADLEIQPQEIITATFDNDRETISSLPGGGKTQWGLEPEYYLVRHIDERGELLEVPVVTKLTTRAPAFSTPAIDAKADVSTGALELRWAPVDGATEYLIVGSYALTSGGGTGRIHKVIGSTTEPEWSSVKDRGQTPSGASGQNLALVSFDGQSADSLQGQGVRESIAPDLSGAGWRYGVIAVNGNDHSRIATADASSVVAALPYQPAFYTWGAKTLIFKEHELADIPVTFAFTSLDGLTRSTAAHIDDDGIYTDDTGKTFISISGVGTSLTWRMEWSTAPRSFDAEAFRADYNARADAARPTTGGAVVVSKSLDEVRADSTPLDTPADTTYPVYGSDEFVQFLAGHLIAGTTLIDVSAFADAPGAQSVSDAMREAIVQNPYAIGVGSYGDTFALGDNRTIISVHYDLDKNEREGIQASIAADADEVLASVVSDGMSDRDKAIAINNWITAQTEYDRPAFDALEADDQSIEPYAYAWRADGVLDLGLAVCEGYAQAYTLLMNQAGVPTVTVTGTVLSGGRHAWNKVQVDGRWLAVDTTWNDSAEPNQFLLIGDADFSGSATRIEDTEWMRDDLIASYVAG
jgi:hypothetical protein